jgi:hypothetical protein
VTSLIIKQQLPKVNNRSVGENSPNPVTLSATPKFSTQKMFFSHLPRGVGWTKRSFWELNPETASTNNLRTKWGQFYELKQNNKKGRIE